MNELASIRAALKRMNIPIVGTNEDIQLYGQAAKAEVVIAREEGRATVGLARQEDGTYAIIGDFYHARDGETQQLIKYYRKDEVFMTELQTAYCIEQAKAKVEEIGFVIEENIEGVVGEDGTITMVAIGYN